MTALRRRMIEDMTLRNFAPRTIEVYVERVVTFAEYFHTSPKRLGPEHIRGYLIHLIQDRHVSWSYYNQARCALQFLYRVTLGQVWVVEDVATGLKTPTFRGLKTPGLKTPTFRSVATGLKTPTFRSGDFRRGLKTPTFRSGDFRRGASSEDHARLG